MAPPTESEAAGEQLIGWPFIEQAYRRIARRAQEEHRPVVVFVFPWLEGLEGRVWDDLSERLRALGEELHWTVIDLAPAFVSDPASLFFEGDPIHPNADGNQRAATYAAARLKTLGAIREGDLR